MFHDKRSGFALKLIGLGEGLAAGHCHVIELCRFPRPEDGLADIVKCACYSELLLVCRMRYASQSEGDIQP